eukprot:TRINITY_DN57198_c0_g1_i1.p1 TRINITY_DN57198_c0_g1~~TRINITY_DN57198_c0_g1_i1.p1  ORF type:complete len:328 (+),score=37.33 TRINITY_DN57198_c0_g1_i1:72-986(+)
MKTVRGVAKHTASCPRRLATAVGALLFVFVVVLGARWTETRTDDILICLVCALLAVGFYLQPDWVVCAAERFEPEVVWRIPTKQARAALTIDDVPLNDRPSHLEEILDVLRKNNVRATFFIMSGFDLKPEKGGMTLEDRERYRGLLKRAVAEGHELGNHLQFDKPAIAMEPKDFETAFYHCDSFLAEMAGGVADWQKRPHRWFRPASGLWSKHMLDVARKSGYRTVLTNCFPHDVSAATRHTHALFLRKRARPGSILLVHDRWHTPKTLENALPAILRGGIQLGTLSELQAVADKQGTTKKKQQ